MLPAQRLCVLCAVYNEQRMLPAALASLAKADVRMMDVLVFDGAWKGFGEGRSTDLTAKIIAASGALAVPPPIGRPYDSQEEKRSEMFTFAYECGFTHAFVFDADERVEGSFPDRLPDGHANVMVKCVGENDMPGIRGEWPRGDYYPDYKPELRLFRLSEELHCKWPGGYWDADGRIVAYSDYAGTSALPVLEGVSFTHHGAERDAGRIGKKIAYYLAEHPERLKRQQEELGK